MPLISCSRTLELADASSPAVQQSLLSAIKHVLPATLVILSFTGVAATGPAPGGEPDGIELPIGVGIAALIIVWFAAAGLAG